MHGPSVVVAGLLLTGLLGSGCTGPGAPAGGATSTPTRGATPGVTTPASTTTPAAVPPASLDPSMSADDLFEDATPAAGLARQERSSETRDGARIRDVRFAGADGRPVSAWLIGPESGAQKAGVLFLHWLGEFDNDRAEFVDEAVDLAGQGVASLLITQRFPWSERPRGVDHDRVAVGLQVRTIERALTLLAAEVGPAGIAVVGHDFGGMYGILAASIDDRITSIVAMAPTATWADWFVKYFHVVEATGADAYAAALADLDPLTRLADVDIPVLFQFGTSDFYVPSAVVRAFTDAAPGGTEVKSYPVGHHLDEAARSDRDAWLVGQLGIGG